jgi:short-chain fatty acids transporter
MTGFLVRAVVKNVKGIDYRAIGAAGYLGLGTVWALGMSSSPALLMATPASIPPALLKISGVIPLSQTIYSWRSLATAGILIVVSTVIAYFSMPTRSDKTAAFFKVPDENGVTTLEPRKTPAEWLEYSPLLSIVVVAMGFGYIAQVISARGFQAAVDLNTFNFIFIMFGLLLHWKPRSFVRAVNAAVPSTAGVLIQFPFYGGIFGIVTMSAISETLAHFFVRISTHGTFPVLVAMYSALLGLFVPSAGSKWIIEAPYVLQAAKDLQVNLGWVVQIYNTAESLPNLVNPSLCSARWHPADPARDLVGFALRLLLREFDSRFLSRLVLRTHDRVRRADSLTRLSQNVSIRAVESIAAGATHSRDVRRLETSVA